MKFRYSISYFILLTSFVIAFLYFYSFQHAYEIDKYAALDSDEEIEIINSNSDDVISEGYYLYEKDGYVVVYLVDGVTLFEETDILLSQLSETMQKEIQNGKYVRTIEELYGFLENYSS
ncbi:MAG: hypothetical protein R3Y58_07490 [Eubacteriales bacterium]